MCNLDSCPKITSLTSRDWAFDEQFAGAVKTTCAKCTFKLVVHTEKQERSYMGC